MKRIFSMCALSLILFGFAMGMTACEGLTGSKSGAPEVESMGSTGGPSAGQCHFTTYQNTVAPIVSSQCLSCHGNPGSGSLLLQAGNSDAAQQTNFEAISSYIESTAQTPDDTSLLGRVGGGLTHSLKLSAGSDSLEAFETFAQEVIGDPECTGTSTSGPVIGI